MTIYTLGYTQKSAEQFFGLLRERGVKRLLDIRLQNTSQLAGFTKKEDLAYFLQELLGAEYQHLGLLAPTKEILDEYRQTNDWERYTRKYLALLEERRILEQLDPALFAGACLLCSEPTPEHCHRRLAAEYLREAWGNIEIVHL